MPADETTGDLLRYLREGGPPAIARDDDADIATKTRVKKRLTEAAPVAAARLAQIAEHGDEKYAVAASEAILDRTGFSKAEPIANNPFASALDPKALITALLGIGRVLGIREVDKLKDVTPPVAKGDRDAEVASLLHTPLLRGLPTPDNSPRAAARTPKKAKNSSSDSSKAVKHARARPKTRK